LFENIIRIIFIPLALLAITLFENIIRIIFIPLALLAITQTRYGVIRHD